MFYLGVEKKKKKVCSLKCLTIKVKCPVYLFFCCSLKNMLIEYKYKRWKEESLKFLHYIKNLIH